MDAIGIDLGTTNSCVAIVKNRRSKILQNPQGFRITPSCVAFQGEDRLIGKPAKDQLIRNPKNTIYEVKRLIGRTLNEEGMESIVKYLPFTVSKDGTSGEPYIEVENNNKRERFTPEVISSMILRYIKDMVNDIQKDVEITKAVVTVPAYFNQKQRQTTIDAARIAGFKDCDIISEPTAAAFAFRETEENQGETKILVYDLGGGTFDVSIVQAKEGEITVLATDGNTRLGGLDFDNTLVGFALEHIEETHHTDLSSEKSVIARLKEASENAKTTLSIQKATSIQMQYEGVSYIIDITRAQFEDMCQESFDETLEIVDRCLEEAKINKEDIDEVLLVGGSTRIPRIQELLIEYFGEKKLNKTVNCDEAVARGAAIYAAMKYSKVGQKVDHIVLHDVIPLSLGTSMKGGAMSILIERNTSLPKKNTKRYYTTMDDQEGVVIDVYEGERKMAKDNNYLNEFVLNVPRRPVGKCSILVTFTVNTNGILEVTAKEEIDGKTENIIITEKHGRYSQEEIDKLLEETEKYKARDEARLAQIDAYNDLESFALRTKSRTTRNQDITKEDQTRIITACEKAIEWLAENKNAENDLLHEQLRMLQLDCKLS